MYTLIPSDRAPATPADIGTTIKLKLAADKLLHVVVAPTITTVSTDSNNEISVS